MQRQVSIIRLTLIGQIVLVLGVGVLVERYPQMKKIFAYSMTTTTVHGKKIKKPLPNLDYRIIRVIGPIRQQGLYQIPANATIRDVIKVTDRPLKPYKMRRNSYKISIPTQQKLLNIANYVTMQKSKL